MSLVPTDKDRAWATGFRSGVESSEAELIALRAAIRELRGEVERLHGVIADNSLLHRCIGPAHICHNLATERAEVERLREIFRYECLIWCRCALFMSNERDETLHEDTCPYRKSILGTTDQPENDALKEKP